MAIVAMVANAQPEHMKAFRNVGVGAEVGLMGVGFEVAVPVVTNHLVLKSGFQFPKVTAAVDVEIDTKIWREQVDMLNNQVRRMNTVYGKNFPSVNWEKDEIVATADAEVNLSNFKIMLEYYPWESSNFHLIAGFMIGKDKFISITGQPDNETQEAYNNILMVNRMIQADQDARLHGCNGIPDLEDYLHFNIDETTYSVSEKCGLDASIKINKVKPYFGVGFGRSIPNHRVGFQFEMGAWMHGKPTIYSPYELKEYDEEANGIEGVGEILSKVTFYPQITFRLTGRIL